MVLGVLGLLTWYVVYTQQVVRELRVAAAGQGQMYSRIFRALQDTSATHDPTVTLLELSQQIRESGLPLVLTDPDGRVSAVANLPFDEPLDGDRTRAFLRDGSNCCATWSPHPPPRARSMRWSRICSGWSGCRIGSSGLAVRRVTSKSTVQPSSIGWRRTSPHVPPPSRAPSVFEASTPMARS